MDEDAERRESSENEPLITNRFGDEVRQTPKRRDAERSERAEESPILGRQVPIRSVRDEGLVGDGQVRKRSVTRSEGAEGSLILDRQVPIDEKDGSLTRDRQIRKRSKIRDGSLIRDRQVPKKLISLQGLESRSSSWNADFTNRSRTRRRETPQRSSRNRSRRNRTRSNLRIRFTSSDDEKHTARVGRLRHRSYSSDDYDAPTKRLFKRRRSRPASRRAHRDLYDDDSSTNGILNKFFNILSNVKGQSTHKLFSSNVLPEFNPLSKGQTIITWLTKVEECAEIYGWDEREIIHFALPKLSGVAKLWYEGLNTVLYTWTEWKRKLIESFPCRQDYADLLTEMLAKRARYGESLEQYYYAKINLLNICSITGRRAVDCLLNGVEDRAVRVGAQAAGFRVPEDVLKYFKTVNSGNTRDIGDKPVLDKTFSQPSKTKSDQPSRVVTLFKCHNCNEDGHRSFKCSKPSTKCNLCGKLGHLDLYCRSRQNRNVLSSMDQSNDNKNNNSDQEVEE